MQKFHKFIKTIPPNVEGSDFIVGDLHGCYNELRNLLQHVNFDPTKDRLFSTGDLIDRGPQSKECLSLLKKQWFHSVLGNHEDILLEKINKIQNNNANEFTKNEMEEISELISFVPYLLDMPLICEIEHLLHGKIYIVHSEILPEHLFDFVEENILSKEYDRYLNTMKKYDFSSQLNIFFENNRDKELSYLLKQKLIWSRKIVNNFYKDHKNDIDKGDFSFMIKEKFNQESKIFCGHNIVPFPMKIGQQYYIDTGSALGYSSKKITSPLFSQFGHEFFTLSMVNIDTGICYGCISSEKDRGKILKIEKSLYEIG